MWASAKGESPLLKLSVFNFSGLTKILFTFSCQHLFYNSLAFRCSLRGVWGVMFDRESLRLLKFRAENHGVWFRCLSRLDRALVDLAIRVADRVRSHGLAKALASVMRKVEEALENSFSRVVYRVGFALAQKAGLAAKSWGHPSAESWMCDLAFARFLGLMYVNGGRSMVSQGLSGA